MIAEGAFYSPRRPGQRLGAHGRPDPVLARAGGSDRPHRRARRRRSSTGRPRRGADDGPTDVRRHVRRLGDAGRLGPAPPRPARASECHLAEAELGAFLCFDTATSATSRRPQSAPGRRQAGRFCLLPRGGDPIIWDFGSAARHHALHCPWLGEERSRAGISTLRGAMPRGRRAEEVARKIHAELEEHGLTEQPLGVDIFQPPVLFALQRSGIQVVDGQELMQDARRIKTADEITLLTHACTMVDAAYERALQSDAAGRARERLRRGGQPRPLLDGLRARRGRERDLRRALQPASAHLLRPRAAPRRPRLLRHHPLLPGLPDLLLPHARRRLCVPGARRRLQALPLLPRHRDRRDAPRHHDGATSPALWPQAEEFGFPNEEAAFALQYGHGVGLSVWEKPLISRLVSLDHPEPIEEGMVIALETFWPSSDGWCAARIEEQLVVTRDGCEVITRFPAEELLVAGHRYFTRPEGCRRPAKSSPTATAAARSPRRTRSPLPSPTRSRRAPPPRSDEPADALRGDHAGTRPGSGDRQGRAVAEGHGRPRRRRRADRRDRDGQGHRRTRGRRRRLHRRPLGRRG